MILHDHRCPRLLPLLVSTSFAMTWAVSPCSAVPSPIRPDVPAAAFGTMYQSSPMPGRRGVNGSDRMILSQYPLPYFWSDLEWIIDGYRFEYRLYQTTDSVRKWHEFGPEMDKYYQINTHNKTYFTIANNTNKNYLVLQIVQTFINVKIIVLNKITPRWKPYVNYTYVKVLLRFICYD
jgi:hypothetical protein